MELLCNLHVFSAESYCIATYYKGTYYSMLNLKAHSFIQTLCLITSILTLNVFASTVTVSSHRSGTHYIEAEKNNSDILTIAPKNAQYDISFNKFSNFKITRPLIIYNGIKATGNTNKQDSANVIVISARDVQLSSHIEIIGAPADLLIVSNSSSPLRCNNCSFSNVGRLTLVHGTYSNSNNIGDISTRNSTSAATIDNLSAPGVLSVEIIARSIALSGVTDTNLRADTNPNSGMIVNSNGAKIIGSGGVNLYSGSGIIRYSDLLIKSLDAGGRFAFSGAINAASIAISSANSITLSKGSTLNTLSDALSSSTRNGQFYAPLEGIFLSTLNNQRASININGALTTDNSISLKSHKDISLSTSSKVVTNKIELLAKGIVSTSGIIQASDVDIAATEYRNIGHIEARNIVVETTANIFNSYGGLIKAKTVTLSTPTGKVTNGSRSTKINYQVGAILPQSADLEVWGIKSAVSNTGANTSNLSAHILANEIYIDSSTLENINPYYVDRPSTTAWDAGIAINNASSNRVSIQAENKLAIKALGSVLNASALIALNQNGAFHLNTPTFSNERYHLAVGLFKYTQLTLSDNKKRDYDIIETGDATKITAYSPPGRVYSFGDFRFNHVKDNTQAKFINEFSYFEVFKDVYFYKAEVKSLGLETGVQFQGTDLQNIRSCMIYQNCVDTITTTSAESETLFSIRGNVYGIDPNIPSKTDLTIDNLNTLELIQQGAIKVFLATKNVGTHRDDYYSYVKKSNVIDDILTATVITCRTYEPDHGRPKTVCKSKEITQRISALIDDKTKDDEHENSTYSLVQMQEAARAYIQKQPHIYQIEGTLFNRTKYLLGTDFNDISSQVTITYKEVTIDKIGIDDREPGLIRTITITRHKTITIPLSTLEPYIK
jgi:hypothetical protein